MNEALFDLINQEAGRVAAVDALARFLASDGIFLLAAALGVLGAISLVRDRSLAGRAAAAAIVAIAVTGLMILASGQIIFENRPFVGDPDTVRLIAHAADNGFPSDHASVGAAIATVGGLAWPRWAPVLAVLLVLTTVSRVFVGVHLPGDVAAGWLLGGSAAVAGWYLVGRLSSVSNLLRQARG